MEGCTVQQKRCQGIHRIKIMQTAVHVGVGASRRGCAGVGGDGPLKRQMWLCYLLPKSVNTHTHTHGQRDTHMNMYIFMHVLAKLTWLCAGFDCSCTNLSAFIFGYPLESQQAG